MEMDLKQIKLVMSDHDIDIKTEVVKAKSLTGLDRKLKGQDLIGVLKVDENTYIAFVEE
jgi:hypothetical protein|tara:strand:+ start:882 stop:1058 length:177 start_codon:yes stop_codon:yes gene_type:complete